MVLTCETADNLCWAEKGDEVSPFKVVEQGEWVHEGKAQYKETIFSHEGRFYQLNMSRTGSDYSEWTYNTCTEDQITCEEVRKEETITHRWVLCNRTG